MGGAQGIRAVVAVLTTMIVARIITPSDYGVLAMSGPVLAFVYLFQDLGLSAATVQAKEIRNEQSSTIFWVNIAVSLLIAALLIIASPAISDFYGDERVGRITAASAGLVLLGSLTIQHTALLTRQMRFGHIGMIIVSGVITTAIATIALAYLLANYWALFFGTLAGSIVQLVLTWAVSEWRPGPRASWSETRPLIDFGGYVAVSNLLNFLTRNADNILIGRYWGAAQLGLYDRSYRLMFAQIQFINSPLARVVLPVLSRLRDEPERYRTAYLFNLRALLLVTVPAAALAASASEQVIRVLLGPAWFAAVPIFFWLALAMLFQPIGNYTGWLFQSSGRAKAYAWWGLVSSVITVASFVVGVRWGAVGVAKAYVIMGVVRFPFLLRWATKDTPVRAIEIALALIPFAIGALGIWIVTMVLEGALAPLPLLVVGLPLGYALLIASLYAFPDGRRFLVKLLELIKALRRGASFEQSEMSL